jgi:hypothetical protein
MGVLIAVKGEQGQFAALILLLEYVRTCMGCQICVLPPD